MPSENISDGILPVMLPDILQTAVFSLKPGILLLLPAIFLRLKKM
ncbi:TPA: hypothetical protein ACE8JD_001400 [Neisseria gonorrhoeae]